MLPLDLGLVGEEREGEGGAFSFASLIAFVKTANQLSVSVPELK